MGVAPNKTFTFDGVSSSTYGVYITGEGVFNAPQRSVEMIEIPGRNGNYALDQGRFENIEVTYKCGMFDVTESNFATKVSNFRNWICSKVGYVKLSDEYNPDEYRMAVYSRGLEVSHEMLIAGEFEITFECKPQRWLTSGETAVTVANNGTLSNPTLFDASPLLQFNGYGNIGFNGYTIRVQNVPLGDVSLISDNSDEHYLPHTLTLNTSIVNNGDSATASATFWSRPVVKISGDTSVGTTSGSAQPTDSNSNFTSTYANGDIKTDGTLNFNIGTNATASNTVTGTANYYAKTKGDFTVSYSVTESIQYTASTGKVTFSCSGTVTTSTAGVTTSFNFINLYNISITAYSTVSALIYIDCDLGEVYTISNNQPVTVNDLATLGSDLPKLSPGTNTFTKDNTITNFKVTPRWWKV